MMDERLSKLLRPMAEALRLQIEMQGFGQKKSPRGSTCGFIKAGDTVIRFPCLIESSYIEKDHSGAALVVRLKGDLVLLLEHDAKLGTLVATLCDRKVLTWIYHLHDCLDRREIKTVADVVELFLPATVAVYSRRVEDTKWVRLGLEDTDDIGGSTTEVLVQ